MCNEVVEKSHDCCTMFLFTSGRMRCVKKLLKIITSYDLFLIIFRPKGCVKRLLKNIQKP